MRQFIKYPRNYVKATMTYKRRGRFLDSSDGRWVICKDQNFPAYYLVDKTKGANGYVLTESGAIRTWRNLKDVKEYIENGQSNRGVN